MNRFFYTQMLRLFKPIALRWLESRAKKAGGGDWQIRSDERFGKYIKREEGHSNEGNVVEESSFGESIFLFQRPVWVHAVSLGETRAAQPLITALLEQGLPVLLTHMTMTGRELGKRLFAEEIGRGQLAQAWIPYDLPQAVEGFLRHWQPRCGILIERELWPNMLAYAEKLQVPMLLVSARFSEKTLRQAQWLGSVMKKATASLKMILAQTAEDASRLEQISSKPPISIVGNLKFDLSLPVAQIHCGTEIKKHLGREMIAVASIREGEELLFIQEIANQKQKLKGGSLPLFLLIPRHPQTYGECRALLREYQLKTVIRSKAPTDDEVRAADVMLCDTVGEMFFYYAMSDVAIVGGSFLPFGGQNHIEPCALGVPVIFGSHTENFVQSAQDALEQGAARRVDTVQEAVDLALEILYNPELKSNMSQAGRQWLSLHEGATERIMRAIAPYLQ